MGRIENLGDYGTIWKDLAAFGGSKDALFDAIGENAVAAETPGIIAKTLLIAAPILLVTSVAVHKGYQLVKARVEALEREPELREEFKRKFEEQDHLEELNQ